LDELSISSLVNKKIFEFDLNQFWYLIRCLNAIPVLLFRNDKNLNFDLRDTTIFNKLIAYRNYDGTFCFELSYRLKEFDFNRFFKDIEIRKCKAQTKSIGRIPSSRLPYDIKSLPKFSIDLDLDKAMNALKGLDSIELKNKGPMIIKSLINNKPCKYFTIAEVSKKFRVDQTTVLRRIWEGKIKATRLKGCTKWSIPDNQKLHSP
jgi:hypothetical protein